MVLGLPDGQQDLRQPGVGEYHELALARADRKRVVAEHPRNFIRVEACAVDDDAVRGELIHHPMIEPDLCADTRRFGAQCACHRHRVGDRLTGDQQIGAIANHLNTQDLGIQVRFRRRVAHARSAAEHRNAQRADRLLP